MKHLDGALKYFTLTSKSSILVSNNFKTWDLVDNAVYQVLKMWHDAGWIEKFFFFFAHQNEYFYLIFIFIW